MPTTTASLVIGLSYASLLFLVSVGLLVVFGPLRFVNLATGSLYLIGGYVSWTVARSTGNFVLALAAGAVAALITGVVIERGASSAFIARNCFKFVLPWGLPTSYRMPPGGSGMAIHSVSDFQKCYEAQ